MGAVLASALFAWIGWTQARARTAGGASSSAASARVLRVGHGLPTSHPVHTGILHFAERVAAVSGGALHLEVFPNEQLGNETQCLEQVQAGTLDITKVNASQLGNFIGRVSVFGLPYLFRDANHFWAFLDGPDGQSLLAGLHTADNGNPSGIQGLAYYDGGSRSFYGKDPITTPDDLRGRKYRVMNDPVAMDMVQAFGASPTPISYGELYTALRQGVVDGAENNPASFVTSRHFEIAKHYSLDEHTRIPDVLLVSDLVWKSLDTRQQAWLRQAAEESGRFQRRIWAEETEKSFAAMRAAGVTIHTVDTAAFRARTADLVKRYETGPAGELMRKIRETP
ncbi:MAG: TRAP transporter substrate-binding protein [Burkholderiales bacterium]|nr:TRAP transporter substrate-binding protein [Opitutaceae bacterium]